MADTGEDKDDGKVVERRLNLAFVNMTNVASQAEKERNRKIVRSTAMKSFRRKQNSERHGEEMGKGKRKDKITAVGRGTSSSIDASLLPSRGLLLPGRFGARVRQSDGSSPSSSSSDSNTGEEIRGIETAQNDPSIDQDLQVAAARSSPRTMLGAGGVDPFSDYPVDMNNTSHVPELIDHCESSTQTLRL